MSSPSQSFTPEESQELPWYHEGLRFQCTQCGNCCTGSPGAVWVNDAEIQAIADYLNEPVGAIRLLATKYLNGKVSIKDYPNGDCYYFDPNSRGCKIYPVRPIQCRTWPFWDRHLTSVDAWNDVGKGCPGINKGKLVSLEIIEQNRKQRSL